MGVPACDRLNKPRIRKLEAAKNSGTHKAAIMVDNAVAVQF